MRTKNLPRNTMLSIGLVTVVLLKLILWPTALINRQLSRVGTWIIMKWK